jgi:hypothetical protein
VAGIAAATPALAGPSPAPAPRAHMARLDAGVGPQGCGLTRVQADGFGGWTIDWTNCWGNYDRWITLTWSNGKGNTYVNDELCNVPLRTGETDEWIIPASETPGGGPNLSSVTGVTFCLDFPN